MKQDFRYLFYFFCLAPRDGRTPLFSFSARASSTPIDTDIQFRHSSHPL
jgi:hypothetical protein